MLQFACEHAQKGVKAHGVLLSVARSELGDVGAYCKVYKGCIHP